METPARQLISFTEAWWGASLDDGSLVERVRGAPIGHLLEFYNDLPFESSAHPELTDYYLPDLRPGELRPTVPFTDLSAASILLYSDSIVLGADYLGIMSEMVVATHITLSDEEIADGAAWRLAQLARLKPLIERDLVYFTNITALPYQYEYHVRGDRDWRRHRLDDHGRSTGAIEEAISERAGLLHKTETLFSDRKVTPVAYDPLDAAAIAQWRASSVDARAERVGALGRVLNPDVRVSLDDLVSLRTNDELFAQWREALGAALGSVHTLGGTSREVAEARAIVAVELDRATASLRKSIERSAALKRMTRGVRAFALGAFTTAGGLVGDDAEMWRKAAMAAGGGLAAGAIEASLPRRRAARESKLVERLVLDFQISTPEQPFGEA